jgi:hypothetical protein
MLQVNTALIDNETAMTLRTILLRVHRDDRRRRLSRRTGIASIRLAVVVGIVSDHRHDLPEV